MRRALRGGEFALYGGGFGDDIETRLFDTLTAAHSKNSASSLLAGTLGIYEPSQAEKEHLQRNESTKHKSANIFLPWLRHS